MPANNFERFKRFKRFLKNRDVRSIIGLKKKNIKYIEQFSNELYNSTNLEATLLRKIPNAKLRKQALTNAVKALGYKNKLSEEEMINILKQVYSDDIDYTIFNDVGLYYGTVFLLMAVGMHGAIEVAGETIVPSDSLDDKEKIKQQKNIYKFYSNFVGGFGIGLIGYNKSQKKKVRKNIHEQDLKKNSRENSLLNSS